MSCRSFSASDGGCVPEVRCRSAFNKQSVQNIEHASLDGHGSPRLTRHNHTRTPLQSDKASAIADTQQAHAES